MLHGVFKRQNFLNFNLEIQEYVSKTPKARYWYGDTEVLNSYLRSIWCGFVYEDFSMVQLFRNILEMAWDHGQSHELNLSYPTGGTMRKKFS